MRTRAKLLCLLLAAFSLEGRATELSIDDPKKLQTLEAAGLDFSRWVLNSPTVISNNQALRENKLYASFSSVLENDIAETAKTDSNLSTSMGKAHRLFNKAWFSSKNANYELVGIVHRSDRAPFNADSCGEIRFVYRLAYRFTSLRKSYSRLPMTLNAVYLGKKTQTGCFDFANGWNRFLESGSRVSVQKSDFLIDRLKSLEVNLQIVRWPSTVRPDMGGYAEYLLRVFEQSGDRLVPSVLENTIEPSAFNSTRKKALLDWIAKPENLTLIDQGIAVLPKEFLATKAVSVALAGPHRLKNAPYTAVFTEDDFKHLDFDGLQTIKSTQGLFKRLNDLSCVGCHQGRTVAGFHFLGKDRNDTDAVNSIHVASSPHFLTDQARRKNVFAALLQRKSAPTYRDISVKPALGVMGAHCGLGDLSFKEWTCGEGLECVAAVQDSRVSKTGVCMPKTPQAGSLCTVGSMKHNLDSHRDRIVLKPESSCGTNRICESVSVGFPSGMCSGGCENLKPGEICGSIAVLHGFNQCLAIGISSFSDCLTKNVRPGALQECSETQLCRDDFICTRVGNKGGCIPPYFLFQLRVDGHPSP